MIKRLICLTLLLCMCSWLGTADAQLKVDFSTPTSPVEDGFEAYTASHEVANTFTSQTFDAFGSTITVTPSWAEGAANTIMQLIDRGTDNDSIDGMDDLIREWIGSDTRSAGDPMTLTISGLPAGTYKWISYHHDRDAQAMGMFDVTLNDAAGSVTTNDIQISGTLDSAYAVLELNIVSEGGDITLVFDMQDYSNQYNEAWFVMNGFEIEQVSGAVLGLASNPKPKNNASDVLVNVGKLSWTPGEFAIEQSGTHNVFIGTDEESVTNATVSDALGTMTYLDLPIDNNSVTLSKLEYGMDYFWRVDEVNNPASTGEYKGKIWKFSTEPEGYTLSPESVVDVNAFALDGFVYPEDQDPNSTFDGSGLDANGKHENGLNSMWLGLGSAPGDVWLQYELDKIYKLHELLIWNYNEDETSTEFGPKDVNVTYSIDNQVWNALDELVEFDRAPGDVNCVAQAIDMNGVIAKYIRLTFLSSWAEDTYTGGLSEIQFSVIPTRAELISPADGADDVEFDTILAWKAGRDFSVHKIYIGTDQNSVSEGIGDIIIDETVEPNYVLPLELSKTYYWKVEEVNNTEEYPVWEGNVWSFSTIQSIVIDNFETGYGNTDVNAVYKTWRDGIEDGNKNVNGSIIGRPKSPYLHTINHSGRYSAPFAFNNTKTSYSSVTADSEKLPIGTTDWSIGSPKTLTIWFRGDPNTTVIGDSELYCIIGGKTSTYSGTLDVLQRSSWTQWDIELETLGANLSNIPDITIGIKKVGSVGAVGEIYLDDIQLTGLEPKLVLGSIWIEAESANPLTAPWKIVDDENVSGGQYIDTENGIGNSADGPNTPDGTATYTFEAEGGVYSVMLLCDSFDDGGQWVNDSMWISFPSATEISPGTNPNNPGWVFMNGMAPGSGFEFDELNSFDHGDQAVTVTLPAGTNTMLIAYREDGLRIDAIELVKISD